jgi:hypothetical protein
MAQVVAAVDWEQQLLLDWQVALAQEMVEPERVSLERRIPVAAAAAAEL